MVGESNQNVFMIQIDASSFEEFEISEFEIARVDCIAENSFALGHETHNSHNQYVLNLAAKS